ncbi:MAG: DUF2066 domain-containing protein [Alphaproteobacteria bacterium]|nr:DUF2066 domain-containing protein [Alphaproteobacteria bacterium]
MAAGRPARGCRGRRIPLALVLGMALAAPLRDAGAQDNPYTATVSVDATAETVAKARDAARTDGARKALAAIAERLSGGKAKPLKLGDNQILDLVASFEVGNEKMTAVRYTADYTYHFRAEPTARALQAAGINPSDAGGNAGAGAGTGGSAAAPGGKPVVVLPVYQSGGRPVLWEDPNPWRQAWTQRPGDTAVSLMVPLGDTGDVTAIDAEKARAGDARALAAIAKAEGSDDVLVLLAVQRSGGLDVTARRYRGGQLTDAHADSVAAKPGENEEDFYNRAVGVIAGDFDSNWKNAKDGLAGQQGSLVVAAPINGLDDWLKLRDLLAALPNVRKIDVRSLSRQEASVEIQYLGTLDQLKASLASSKLDLQGGDPIWRLARTP